MLCWHFTLAVCCKSHQYRSTPEETFSKKNQNKLPALDPTLTSAAPSGQSKIWTPCCCFESFQKLLQAGKLFIFSSASFPPLPPFPSSIFLTWAKFWQCYSPSCLRFPAPSFPRLLHNLLMCRPETKSAWEGKLQSEMPACWLLYSHHIQLSRKI